MSTLYADHGRIINSQEPLPIPVDLMTKLWENPSPTSAFAAQNINLSSSDYDFLLWIVRSSATDAKYFSSIVEKGQNAKVCYPFYYSGMHIRQRTFIYSSDTVYAAENADQDGTADNSDIIPVSVYGFKKQVPMQASGHTLLATVTADGVKTASQLINELIPHLNSLNSESMIEYVRSSGTEILRMVRYYSGIYAEFCNIFISSAYNSFDIQITTGNSSRFRKNAQGVITDESSSVLSSGDIIKLYS